MSSSLLCRRVSRPCRPLTTARLSAASPKSLVARFSTAQDEQQPLETAEDWTKMQLRRMRQKSLIEHFSQYGSTQTRENTWQPHHSLHRPPSPSSLTLSTLIASGAHLGHSTSLLNPNFMPYAYGVRAGITIIDLDHTVPLLRRSANLVRAIARRGGTVVFVGTRPNLRRVVQVAAARLGPHGFYVGEKWLAGTLTNKLQLFGPSVVGTTKFYPDLMIFLNPIASINAIRECAMHHIPTIGIVDSNVDPRIVMYPIPANDESQRTAELVAGVLSIAGREGVALWTQEQERQEKELAIQAERAKRDEERIARAREKGLPGLEF